MPRNEIVIRLVLPAWSRWRWLGLALAAVTAIGGTLAWAADLYKPQPFSKAELLSAAKLNMEFENIKNAINTLDTRTSGYATLQSQVAALQAHFNGKPAEDRVNATYCGISPPRNGNIGGYDGAAAVCAGACNNSKTAHMCRADELIRYVTRNKQAPTGWYATGRYGYVTSSLNNGIPVSTSHNDCYGYTSSDSKVLGSIWGNKFPSNDSCSALLPVLCCD